MNISRREAMQLGLAASSAAACGAPSFAAAQAGLQGAAA